MNCGILLALSAMGAANIVNTMKQHNKDADFKVRLHYERGEPKGHRVYMDGVAVTNEQYERLLK